MLVKVILLFLLVMAGLAMVGRMLRPKRPRLPPPARALTSQRCANCGTYRVGPGPCPCETSRPDGG